MPALGMTLGMAGLKARLSAHLEHMRRHVKAATTSKLDDSRSPSSIKASRLGVLDPSPSGFVGGASLRELLTSSGGAGSSSNSSARDQTPKTLRVDSVVDGGAWWTGLADEIIASASNPPSESGVEQDEADGIAEFGELAELLSAWHMRPKSIHSDTDEEVSSGEEFRGRRRERWWADMSADAPRRVRQRTQPRKQDVGFSCSGGQEIRKYRVSRFLELM
ncbi:hypothetical protein LTR53_003493 [Teratosphaeriaceae sp. CCFEE 6253]|nr:hypothetical protein LTR53_003493 [Teratosphaeriaceae sp. CCFEE 6253]